LALAWLLNPSLIPGIWMPRSMSELDAPRVKSAGAGATKPGAALMPWLSCAVAAVISGMVVRWALAMRIGRNFSAAGKRRC
jgi:hypothetical protein